MQKVLSSVPVLQKTDWLWCAHPSVFWLWCAHLSSWHLGSRSRNIRNSVSSLASKQAWNQASLGSINKYISSSGFHQFRGRILAMHVWGSGFNPYTAEKKKKSIKLCSSCLTSWEYIKSCTLRASYNGTYLFWKLKQEDWKFKTNLEYIARSGLAWAT